MEERLRVASSIAEQPLNDTVPGMYRRLRRNMILAQTSRKKCSSFLTTGAQTDSVKLPCIKWVKIVVNAIDLKTLL